MSDLNLKKDNMVLPALFSFLSAIPVIYFTLLHKLDYAAIQLWDEGRLAVSAFEMQKTGNWLIPTYNYQPDMWSVKPPLMIVLQALCIKLLGANELAVRLPTAIASVATALLLFGFAIKYLKSPLAAFCAVAFLCTSMGYVSTHVARTGDYDALLIFFMTAYFLSAFIFLLTGNYKYYLAFALFLLLALFTKGIGGIFLLPGTVIMLFVNKAFRKKFLHMKFIWPLVLVVICIATYYLVREHLTPGYIKTVIFEEIQGRMFDPYFDMHAPWYFYFRQLVNHDFTPWWVFILVAALAWFKMQEEKQQLLASIFIAVAILWIPISISKNKNYWYSAPVLPLLALASAVGLESILTYFTSGIKSMQVRPAMRISFLLLLFWFPFFNVLNLVNISNYETGIAGFIRDNTVTDGTGVLCTDYNSPVEFYREMLAERGIRLNKSTFASLKTGDTVLVISNYKLAELKEKFDCRLIKEREETQLLQLQSR